MKKWLFLIAITIALAFSGYKIYNLNTMDTGTRVKNVTTHFGEKNIGIAETVLNKPTITKKVIDHGQNKVLRLKVPYTATLLKAFRKSKSLKYPVDMSESIRVIAGGTVWMAQPAKKVMLTGKNWQTTGAVTVDLFIQDGYPESSLRNFQVYMLEDTGTTLTIIHKYI